jgi:hypothetical protein
LHDQYAVSRGTENPKIWSWRPSSLTFFGHCDSVSALPQHPASTPGSVIGPFFDTQSVG